MTVSPDSTDTGDNPIRVMCVDDVGEVTNTLRLIIDAQPDMECVSCTATADQLIDDVRALDPPPDVVLLDAIMPGRDPFMAMCELAVAFPRTRTIVYSGQCGEAFVNKTRANGARGYLSKNDSPETILHAVRTVAGGRLFFPGLAH